MLDDAGNARKENGSENPLPPKRPWEGIHILCVHSDIKICTMQVLIRIHLLTCWRRR